MKAFVCEMCNSNDLVKQDGFFVCQSCGTKYTVEEAKKLLGTVKIDDSDELNNLYELARRARDNNNIENAQKYYEQIMVKDPSSWEANFFSVYFQSMNTNIAGIINAAVVFTNNLDSVFKLIKNSVNEKEQYSILLELYSYSLSLARVLSNSASKHYNGIDYSIQSNYDKEAVDRCYRSAEIIYFFVIFSSRDFTANEEVLALYDKALADYTSLCSNIPIPVYRHSINPPKYSPNQLNGVISAIAVKEKLKGKSESEMIAFAKSETISKRDNAFIPLYISEAIETQYNKSAFTEFLKAVHYLRLRTFESEKSAIDKIESAKRIGGLTREDVAELIDLGVGTKDFTLLMFSARHLKYDAISYLIELGADVNRKTPYNVTALWLVTVNNKGSIEEQVRCAKILLDNGAKIDRLNPDTPKHVRKMILEKNPETHTRGCYVATAVYGSYDCPQVWTLRRYRDYKLSKTWYGRAFIHTYYAISPTLVKWFGKTNWFKNMWKPMLDKMVRNLNSEGVDSTPYEDKQW